MAHSSSRPKLVFYDATNHDVAYFGPKLSADFVLVTCPDPLSSDNLGLASGAQVVSVFVSSAVPKETIEKLPDLKLIVCRSAGFDKVDTGFAQSRGVLVATVPSYGAETVAEYAFLLLLAVARRLMQSAHAARFGGGTPEKLMGRELYGKTLGVIGTGRIGRHAAALGRGFGMRVIAYDPYPNDQTAGEIGYDYVTLDEVLAGSDCLTLHAPAMDGTSHLLDERALAKVKRGVLIVNTARGSLIDTRALLAALKSGQVGGAGLDVLESEELLDPSAPNHSPEASIVQSLVDELVKIPGVIITRHNAYNSAEAVDRIRSQTVQNIQAWHAGQPVNLVK